MLVLQSTDKIEVVTSAAVALDVVAAFADNTATTFTQGSQPTAIATATTTPIVTAPAAGTTRNVSNLSLRAKGGANTITVRFNNGTAFEEISVALLANERLEYENGKGWSVQDATGATKLATTGGGAATPTGTGFRHVTAGVEDPATKLVDTADINASQVTYAKIQNETANTLLGNPTGGAAAPSELAVGTESLVGRSSGNVTTFASSAQSTLIRAAGSLFFASCAAGQLLGRTPGGADLGFTNISTLGLFSSVNLQLFTASGTYTPTTGMKFCLAFATGSGGGGGGADNNAATAFFIGVGGGGGAGGTAISVFSAATIGASQAVTIGTAGTAGSGTNGTNGGNGGATTLGSLLSAAGGVGGTGSGLSAALGQTSAGGAGGVPTVGLIQAAGGDGQDGWGVCSDGATNDSKFLHGGMGGASFWGGGPSGPSAVSLTTGGTTPLSTAGLNGVAFGTGGTGALCSTNLTGSNGGTGKTGIVAVLEFI